MIVVGLVVLVPLVAGVHSVEVLGLARTVLLIPPVHLQPTSCRSAQGQEMLDLHTV